MYNLTSFQSLRYCQFVHDLRRIPINVGSPQTQMQRDQVVRVVNTLTKEEERANEESLKRAKARAARRAAAPSKKLAQIQPAEAPKQAKLEALTIRNGSNTHSIASASSATQQQPVAASSAAAAGHHQGAERGPTATKQMETTRLATRNRNVKNNGNNGKKSLRLLREASREQQCSSTPSAAAAATAVAQVPVEETMIISGLNISSNIENAAMGDALPSVLKSGDNMPTTKFEKEDDIMAASPVAPRMKPQPPVVGNSKKRAKVGTRRLLR